MSKHKTNVHATIRGGENRGFLFYDCMIDNCLKFQVDCYGTVQPHTLIRQHLDYGHWYDRTKLSLKDIHNCQYVSCMNPTAGSFTINPRLQRHFCVIAVRYNSCVFLTNQ